MQKFASKRKISKVVVEESSDEESTGSDNEVLEDAEVISSNGSDSEGEIDEESKMLLNEGWADSIAKILKTNKPKKKKSLVLSKAKKLTDPVKKIKIQNYEIVTADGDVKPEQTADNTEPQKEATVRNKKRDLPKFRVKPSILEKDRERTLQKIATRGVVQLFNVVKIQQKDIKNKLSEAGPLEVRKEKVLKNIDKRAFLDLLMGEKSGEVEEVPNDNDEIEEIRTSIKKKVNESATPSWNVLRDDFLLSAKIKDWDKEVEVEDSDKELEINEEIESD